MNPKVDFYFKKNADWQPEIEQLRTIVLDCELNEDLKWGCPCYAFEKNNIVLIHVFKEYCALLFFKGVLLKNSKKLLIQQTENVQAARQMRFTDKYPKTWIYATGSTKARTRLYRMGISKLLIEITTDFEILGELGDDWEDFKVGTEYEGFLVRRKK